MDSNRTTDQTKVFAIDFPDRSVSIRIGSDLRSLPDIPNLNIGRKIWTFEEKLTSPVTQVLSIVLRKFDS